MNNSIGGKLHANAGIVTTTSDLIGRRFGRLLVIEQRGFILQGNPNGKSRQTRRKLWLCRCDCGNDTIISTNALTRGNTKSCGCLSQETTGNISRTHGQSKSAEYRTWCLMRDRCFSPDNKKFADYGGRGITVCERWRHSFENFLADIGMRPFPRAEIERIGNNGNYEPGNCRWATRKEQTRNKRNNHLLTYQGKTQCVAAWSEETGLSQRMIWDRICRYGWSIEDALTLPITNKWRRLRGDRHQLPKNP